MKHMVPGLVIAPLVLLLCYSVGRLWRRWMR